MLGAYALLGVSIALVHIFFKLPLGYGENTTLVSAWGILNGHGLYFESELHKIPAFVSLYPPFYYLLVAAGLKLWGISYVPGRLFALFSALGCAGMIGLIARRRFESDILGSVIGALLFLCSWPVIQWIRYLRVDFTAIFFELVAAYFLLGGATRRRSALFVIFAILAGYTKQNAFGIVAGAMAGMFIEGDAGQRKKALVIGVFYAAAALMIFFIIQVLSKGGFYLNAVGYNLPFSGDWRALYDRTIQLLGDPLGLCVILLGFLAASRKSGPLRLKALIVLPLVITLPSLSRIGANINYFVELLAASSIAAAWLLAPSEKSRNQGKMIAACCLVLILCLGGSIFSKWPVIRQWSLQLYYYDIALKPPDILTKLKITQKPGSLIYAQYSEMPLFAGCVPAVSDPWHFAHMARAGIWNPAPLVNALKNRQITVIIMKEKITANAPMEFMPDEAARAALDNYSLIPARPNGFYVYLPNPKSGPQ